MDPIAHAQAHLDAVAARCAADPERPRCHLLPPGRWMNDPNGTIFHDGWYHVFFQLNPYGEDWGHMHWGHARSRDLATWEHLPIALAPAVEDGEEHCFSGCIARDADGGLRLLYTSVAFAGRRPYVQAAARPRDADLIAWERLPGTVLGGHGAEARDPFVFTWDGATYALLGDGRRVLLYAAEGGRLDRFAARGTLYDEHSGMARFCECPTLLPVDGQALLLYSPQRPVQLAQVAAVEWRLGAFAGQRLEVRQRGRFDLHDAYYATNTLIDAAGRHVVLGWVRGFRPGQGWNGCLAYPRLVEADAVAGIRQRPHPCVDLLRRGPALRFAGRLGQHELGDAGDAVDCLARLDGPACLRLAGIEVAWDGAHLAVGGGAWPIAARELRLRILIDRSVVEIFADDGRSVITRVVHPASRDGRVQLSGDCHAEVEVHRLGRWTDSA